MRADEELVTLLPFKEELYSAVTAHYIETVGDGAVGEGVEGGEDSAVDG